MRLSVEDLLDPKYPTCVVKEYRDVQVELAKNIERALSSKKSLVSEAGTGAGKSFALLFPAILAGERVVVSTHTKGLQAQYMEDLAKLQPVFHNLSGIPDLSFALAKGKGNYLCPANYNMKKDKLDIPARFKQWAQSTVYGDKDESALSGMELWKFWPKISADECVGPSRCPIAGTCGYARARAERNNATVIVANHAITGFDIRFGHDKVLPRYGVLLLDEAHKAEAAFRNAFTTSLTKRRVPKLLDWLFENGALEFEHIKNHARSYQGQQAKAMANAVDQALSRLEDQNDALFSSLPHGYGGGAVRLDREDLEIPLKQMHGSLVTAQRILFNMAELDREMDNFEQEKKAFYAAAKEGKADTTAVLAAQKIDRLIEALVTLYEPDEEGDEAIRFVSHESRDPKIVHQPMNISGHLQRTLFPEHQVIATSATLSQGGDFSNFRARLGFPEDTIEYFALSPFDIENHSILYASMTVPPHPSRNFKLRNLGPREKEKALEEYCEDMADEITVLLRASHGHAFVLFSNRDEMTRIGNLLKEELDDEMDIRLQESSVSPAELSEWFVNAKKPVLCGVKTFWEGISIEGDQLRMVIVTKVPYRLKGDLVEKERTEQAMQAKLAEGLDEKKARAAVFRELDVVEMVWDVKQALGRLLRTMDDYGCAAILDAGIAKDMFSGAIDRNGNKRPGHMLLEDLAYKRVVHKKKEVASFLQKFEEKAKRDKLKTK